MNDKKQGIIYIIMAGFFFALMTFFVRMSGDLPTMQKAFFRNAVAAVAAVILLAKSDEGFKIKKDSWKGLFLRSFFGTTGLICNFYAVDHLAIADANILNKLSPFFAIIMSYFVLKEKANKTEWLCVVTAFIGAVFVVKPSMNVQFFNAMIGVIGGFGAGVAYTFVRKLGKQGERGPVIVMCFSVFSCIVTAPFLLVGAKPMSVYQIVMLLLAGAAATGGQLSITKAYTKAPAKEISVFDYSQVIFAALLGFVFLQQIPDYLSVIGYVIIIGSAIFKWNYNLRYEEKSMNYAGIKYCDIANGLGCRTVLFVSGCRNHCKGCFQPQTWEFDYGEPFDEQIQNEILDSLKPVYVQGITLLGGDPFEEENQEALVPFMRRVKERYPNKDVWAYTGYLYEELLENGRKHTEYTDELLSMIDVLVDGPFIEEQKDITLKFKGSANQRVIDMEKTRATGEVSILEFTKI